MHISTHHVVLINPAIWISHFFRPLQLLALLPSALLCLVYMPLCFQLSRFTDEAASRVYADLGRDIDNGEVPDIASAKVPAVTQLFYVLPVSAAPLPCLK